MDGYCNLIKTLEGEAAVAKAEQEQYAMRVRTRENRVKWLKERMKLYLELTGRIKAQTATGRTIAVQANGGMTPMRVAEFDDPAEIPAEYQKIRIEFDTAKARMMLERGEQCPFAVLEPRGKHLRIR